MSRSEGNAPLTIQRVQDRVIQVLQRSDKISSDKVSLKSHFVNDLGLDSLDMAEVKSAIEEEFGLEIPDEDIENLPTPAAIAKYVCDRKCVSN